MIAVSKEGWCSLDTKELLSGECSTLQDISVPERSLIAQYKEQSKELASVGSPTSFLLRPSWLEDRRVHTLRLLQLRHLVIDVIKSFRCVRDGVDDAIECGVGIDPIKCSCHFGSRGGDVVECGGLGVSRSTVAYQQASVPSRSAFAQGG